MFASLAKFKVLANFKANFATLFTTLKFAKLAKFVFNRYNVQKSQLRHALHRNRACVRAYKGENLPRRGRKENPHGDLLPHLPLLWGKP